MRKSIKTLWLALMALAVQTVNAQQPGDPTAAPSAPTASAANVLSVFSDNYTAAVGKFVGDASDITKPAGKVCSLMEIPATGVVRYGQFKNTDNSVQTVDVSGYEKLEFDVYSFGYLSSGTLKDMTLKVRLNENATYKAGNLTTGAWTHITIPVTDLGTATAVSKIGFLQQSPNYSSSLNTAHSAKIYIANVIFTKSGSTGGGQGGNPTAEADAPTTLPATPTATAADVMAYYSSHYTCATTYSKGSGTGTISQVDVKVGTETRPMIYIKDGFTSWSFVEFADAKNVSEYDRIEFDIYNTYTAEDPIKIRLNESSGVAISTKMKPGEWTHMSVDLSAFNGLAKPVDLTQLQKIGFIHANGNKRTVYLDNIMFVKSSTGPVTDPVSDEPTSVPADPTTAAADVLAFYSNYYDCATTWNPKGAVDVGSVVEKQIKVEDKTVPMLYLKDGLNSWSYFCFNDALDISQYEKLEMDVFNPTNENPDELAFQFKVRLSNTSSSVTVTPDLQEGWTHVVINLADYASVQNVPNLKSVSQIGVINGKGHARCLYVANIYVSGKKQGGDGPEVDADAPQTPAPTPKHQQEDVLSFYGSHYTNAATISLDNAGDPKCTMEEITVDGNKYLRFWGMNWCMLRLTPEVNLEDYDYIHVDVYTKKDPKIVFDFGNGTSAGRTPWQYLAPMEWKSINIPVELLKEKEATLSNLSLIRLFCATGFPIEKLYFDNFYAFKGSPSGDIITYEIPQSPEPIMPKNTVKTMLCDKYDAELSPVVDVAGSAKVTFPKVDEGDRVAKFDQMTSSASMKLENAIDLTGEEYLHINIYRKSGEGSVTLQFRANGSADYKSVETQPEVADKKWVMVNIPVAELTAKGITMLEGVQVTGKGTLYLDNVFAFHTDYYGGLGEEGALQIDWEASKAAATLLNPAETTFMGVNLGSACGGTKHGVLNQQYFYPTKEDLYYFKSRGCRFFRFPFAWERVQHELNGDLDMALDIAKMKEILDECQRLGIHVMLDMHNYCRYRIDGVTYKFGDAVLTKEHFADVWKKLATVFKEYDNIYGYDIMNEPYGLSPGKWQQYAQAAINAIREVDTTTPIVIEGENYASAKTWLRNGAPLANVLTDPNDNIIWQAHKYFDKEGSGHYELGSYNEEMVTATQHMDGISPFVEWCKTNNKRGILGEFGVPEYDSRWLKVLDDVCKYLKENNIDATYWVGGNGYTNDPVSVQPKGDFVQERAQMRVLMNYFNGYDTSTAIENVESGEANVAGRGVYTISGQKLDSANGYKGILIVNGKKIVKE